VDVRFRRLQDADLPLLHAWLNEPGVVRWWEGDDVTWEGVQRDYGSASTDPTEHWIGRIAERPVGWIQCYATADYEDEEEVRQWRALGLDASVGGIDYLVGDPGERGRGLGTAMIRCFLRDVVFPGHRDWSQVAASPMAANVASWRALQKAGFELVGDFDDEKDPCRLFVARRSSPAFSLHTRNTEAGT
jgi:aminoglycoside 6'-N-acetyltransferase